MDKEYLGKIAYNAYCGERGWKSVRGDVLPQWNDQDPALREAWCKAADAVAAECRKGEVGEW